MFSAKEFRLHYYLIIGACLLTLGLSLSGGYAALWTLYLKWGFDHKAFYDGCVIFAHTGLFFLLAVFAAAAVGKFGYSYRHRLIAAAGIAIGVINLAALAFGQVPYR